jgi:hypothetical protein
MMNDARLRSSLPVQSELYLLHFLAIHSLVNTSVGRNDEHVLYRAAFVCAAI